KLSANAQIAQSISNTEKLGLMLLLSFIILLAIFTFLMAKLKTTIQYAADYVSHISDMSFSALAASKLNGELNPLKQALEDCRHQLKVQLDTL
ncbi:hypothetical protein, partial [Bacillus cereus group sp. Bce039]|uniref:hypothetical protein n=1 Tax=Bacillus cereus group sp. Bce039 TaxID=3445230 RepID=UPI003F699367